MREIKFRAKTTVKDEDVAFNNEWVEGDLIFSRRKTYIHPKANAVNVKGELGKIIVMHEVQAETICQNTGLKDKNGNKIWENDVVKKVDTNGLGWHRERNCKVSFDKEGYWLLTTEHGDGYWIGECDIEQLEVIGNIYDNPELLNKMK